ncbi:ATP-binding protein, partial [Planktotalea sp.]|uniref:sensor histidine kinase n=1 Tax=Planktotalea sp. TaxID=2029877 RepID=UPI003296C86B
RTGIVADFSTVVFRNRLDEDAKTALYRVAQEALTNVERHAKATKIRVNLRGDRRGAVLTISDNGIGLKDAQSATSPGSGMGLRNMQERMDQIDGALQVISYKDGTTIEARAPLSHMLSPDTHSPSKAKTQEGS